MAGMCVYHPEMVGYYWGKNHIHLEVTQCNLLCWCGDLSQVLLLFPVGLSRQSLPVIPWWKTQHIDVYTPLGVCGMLLPVFPFSIVCSIQSYETTHELQESNHKTKDWYHIFCKIVSIYIYTYIYIYQYIYIHLSWYQLSISNQRMPRIHSSFNKYHWWHPALRPAPSLPVLCRTSPAWTTWEAAQLVDLSLNLMWVCMDGRYM